MLSNKITRDRYNRYLDYQAGIFSKSFWKLLVDDKDRLGLFVGSTLAVIGGIVGIALTAGITAPAVAVSFGFVCGGIVGAGSGLLSYNMGLGATMNGLSLNDIFSTAGVRCLAGGVAGGLTAGLAPIITSGLELVIATPVLNGLTNGVSEYLLYQTTVIVTEGVIGNRWEKYNAEEMAIDVGCNMFVGLAVGATLGIITDCSAFVQTEEMAFGAMASSELIVEEMTGKAVTEYMVMKENNSKSNRNTARSNHSSSTRTNDVIVIWLGYHHFQSVGDKKPLILEYGLTCSQRNWCSVADDDNQNKIVAYCDTNKATNQADNLSYIVFDTHLPFLMHLKDAYCTKQFRRKKNHKFCDKEKNRLRLL